MSEDNQKLTQPETPNAPLHAGGWPEDSGAPPLPLEKGWHPDNPPPPSPKR